MGKDQFSKLSQKTLAAVSEFLKLPMADVEKFAWEEEDELAQDLFKGSELPKNSVELDISEEIFTIYGRHVFPIFLLEQYEKEIRVRILLFFGKATNFVEVDDFLDTVEFPSDTKIIYGCFKDKEENVDISMEISIISKNENNLYEDIRNILKRFSEEDVNETMKQFIERFENYIG